MQAPTHQHDSAESWITRCPKCSTAFRITRQHLMAAKGAVRCGSCLHVFTASDSIVGGTLPEELSFKPAAPAQQVTQQSIPKKSPAIPKKSPEPQPEATRESLDFSEDAFAVDSSNSFHNHSSYSSSDEESDTYEEDEAWAKAMLEEMELEEDEDEDEDEDEKEEQGVEEDIELASEPAPPPAKSKEAEPVKPKALAKEQVKEKPASILSSLNNDPLDLSYRKQNLWQKLLWPSACTMALLVLIGQYTWANFADISKNPGLRPLATKMCSLLPCQLSEQRDITKILASHIVIRPDRNYQNALIIDAIITNEASFKQPYPNLVMTFFDTEQGVVGQRMLSPEQYLSGEAAGALDMPVRQPIHLALNIISPRKKPHSVDLTFTQP